MTGRVDQVQHECSRPSAAAKGSRTACALMVMPRSRSMSIRSRYWARIDRSSTTPVSLQHPVGQRRLAVVDVGDDAEVPDDSRIGVPRCRSTAGRRASGG